MKSLFILLVTLLSGLIAIPVVRQLPAQSVQQSAVQQPAVQRSAVRPAITTARTRSVQSSQIAGSVRQESLPNVNGTRLRATGQNQADFFYQQNYPSGVARSYFSSAQHNKLQSQIDSQLGKYKKSTKDDKRKEIEQEIEKLLGLQFDERLKEPEARIKNSKTRLDNLKKQIKNRESKSDEIIDLRVKVLTHQVTGLGWGSGSHRNTGFTYTYPSGYYAPYQSQNQNGTQWRFNAVSPSPAAVPKFPGNAPRPTTPPKVATGIYADPGIQPGVTVAGTLTKPKSDDDKPTVAQLLSDYSKAEDDSERKPIVKELRSLLEEEFEAYQDSLTQSAERIEKQISTLQENLEKRQEMKESIVELKLKTIINQANGLGF